MWPLLMCWLSVLIGDNDSMHHGADTGIGSHYHCLRPEQSLSSFNCLTESLTPHCHWGAEQRKHLIDIYCILQCKLSLFIHSLKSTMPMQTMFLFLRDSITFTSTIAGCKRTLHCAGSLQSVLSGEFMVFNLINGRRFYIICLQNVCKKSYLDPMILSDLTSNTARPLKISFPVHAPHWLWLLQPATGSD